MTRPTDPHAEAIRRELRLLLSRRAFVGAGVAATMTALGLGACSSGGASGDGGNTGGNPDTSSLTPINGLVSLPSGSTLNPTTLSVNVGGSTSSVAASGGFSASISNTGPSLALLQDASGNVVLMGMIDPAQPGSFAITAQSTATAILHFALGGFSLPPDAMSRVRTLIDSDPAAAALAQSIASAVAANPVALQSSTTVGNAVLSAVQTITQSSITRPAASLRDDPTLLLINPTDDQGGIRVDQQTNASALVITNSKRRPARVYVYAITTLAGNTTTQIIPAKRIVGPVELSATTAINTFNTLHDLIALVKNPAHPTQTQWQPVTLDPIPLALESGTDRTTFEVVVITASFKSLALDTFEPAVYRDTHFGSEVATWRADEAKLLFRCIFGEILFPLVCLLGGLGAMSATQSSIAGVVDALAAERSAAFTRIISQLEYGGLENVSEAMAYWVRTALTSDVSTIFYRSDVQSILGRAQASAAARVTPTVLQTRMTAAGSTFLKVMEPLLAAEAILRSVDIGAVLTDLVTSDVAEAWTALLMKQTLNLTPQLPSVTPGERVAFMVSAPANTTDQIRYVWTQTSQFAVFSSAGDGQAGATITTLQRNVDLVTTGSDSGTITVDVKAYDLTVNPNNPPQVGEAKTTVRLLQRAQITPTNPAININQQVVFVVQVDGTLPPGVHYRWTLTGTAGTIGSSNVVDTSVPQITYTGKQSGTDVIHVDVLDSANQLIAKADDGVAVALQPSIHFTVTGPWPQGPANGTYNYTLETTGRDPDGPAQGYDGYIVAYGLAAFETATAFLTFQVPVGAQLFTGEHFVWDHRDPNNSSNNFGIAFAANQNSPDGSGDVTGTFGTLTFDAVSKTSDGGTLIQYHFTMDNATGGSINGTGVAKV